MPAQTTTDKTITGLKPGPKPVDYWDTVLKGFALRVGTTGAKSFFVGVRIRGKYRRVTLKPQYPHLALADARKKGGEIINDAQGGIAPEVKQKREEKGTFGAVAADFLADYAKNLRTKDEMKRYIKGDLAEWHDRQIAEITRADIKELLRKKARTAPIAANRLLSLISRIFSWALKEELIDASPAMRLDRPGKETERERALSADEIRSVWAACDPLGYPWGPLFKMLLLTGQRRSEVAGMKWSEITTEGWRLPAARSKGGKGHLVPLSSLAREVLADVPQLGELVFRCHHDKLMSGWSQATARLNKHTGAMEPWRLHDLRRTFATQLREIGVDRLVVSKLLNHAEAGVTKIYDRYTADPEKTAAMERWANRLREIISGGPASNVVQLTA